MEKTGFQLEPNFPSLRLPTVPPPLPPYNRGLFGSGSGGGGGGAEVGTGGQLPLLFVCHLLPSRKPSILESYIQGKFPHIMRRAAAAAAANPNIKRSVREGIR